MTKEGKQKALAPAELREARAALARARGKKRLDLILDALGPVLPGA